MFVVEVEAKVGLVGKLARELGIWRELGEVDVVVAVGEDVEMCNVRVVVDLPGASLDGHFPCFPREEQGSLGAMHGLGRLVLVPVAVELRRRRVDEEGGQRGHIGLVLQHLAHHPLKVLCAQAW